MRTTEKNGSIICQRCLAPNSLELEFCGRCGTRLMLVVEPTALRFEEEALVGDYEEHLLERVSSLESKLARVWEKLEQAVEYLSRSVRTSYFDHILLETLLAELGESRVVSRRRVEQLWHERFERDAAAMAETSRREELRTRVTARYTGGERAAFARLVSDGFELIEKGRETQGLRQLERAAALAPGNAPLNSFIGEHFFRARKMTLARDYLARALDAEPGNRRTCLLLGLVCGDQGDAARARSLLRQSVSGGQLSFAAHYALGRLHAAESDWKGALSEFRQALAARKCPEAHYMLGLCCYQLGRHRTALRHLRNALDTDGAYGDALYLLGLVHLRLGERADAARAFEASRAARGAHEGPAPRKTRKKTVRLEDFPPPALFPQTRGGRRRLLTGGDTRVAAALREDALGTPAGR
jgi:tetratricopeptide (TPR) repeat protein